MSLGKNTIADKDKLAKLQAELINLDTKKLRSQRLLQTQITTAVNQERAEKEKLEKEEQTRLDKEEKDREDKLQKEKDAEQKRLDSIKEIQDTFEELQAEENAIKEEEKAQLEADKAIAELDKLNATEEQKAKIVAYWNGQIQIGKDKDAKRRS